MKGWVARGALLWLPFAVAISVSLGTIYLVQQQALRIGANDPQIQLAEDGARMAATSGDPTALLAAPGIDASLSLAPFVIQFDSAGRQVRASARTDAVGDPPAGLFSDVARTGQQRFTWQPREGLRFAAVLQRVDGGTGGFVLAARSLREVERRETQLLLQVGLAWAGGLVLSLVTCLGAAHLRQTIR